MAGSHEEYASRDIEANILTHVQDVLSRPQTRVHTMLITGPPGYGSKSALLKGVIPQLRSRTSTKTAPISGRWESNAAVQYCVSTSEIPQSPPAKGSPVRLLLCALTDFSDIPAWITDSSASEVHTFPVGVLSLLEAHRIIDAQLGTPMSLISMRTLAELSGYVPSLLVWLVRQCLAQDALERIDGYFRLLGDPVQLVVLPYLRAQLAAATPQEASALFHLALTETVSAEELATEHAKTAIRMLRNGELHREESGALRFASPAIATALRQLSPAAIQQRTHLQTLQSAQLTGPAIHWAAAHGVPICAKKLERAAGAALARHDWTEVTDIAEHG